jgi:hypothetical protein
MRGRGLAVLAAVVTVLLFAPSAQAGLTRLNLDVFTTNYPEPVPPQTGPLPELCVWIQVSDYHNYRGPDFVGEITVTAPDGSVFDLDPSKDWLQYDRIYWRAFHAADFKKNKIPGGTYKVTVVSLDDLAITESDAVSGTLLPIPVVIFPTPGTTGVMEPVTFKWNAVAGANHYRIQLWNINANSGFGEPVYWNWDKQMRTHFTSFEIPIGELKPKCEYRLRIEARSESQDLDMRSRSVWINFTTGSWD